MLRPKQHQRQTVFAGEFAAGAGAAESRFGLIDLHLIGLRSAALAFAPQHCLGSVQGRPFAGNHQTFGGLGRGGIGRELQNFVNAKRHERDSDRGVGWNDGLILSGFWRKTPWCQDREYAANRSWLAAGRGNVGMIGAGWGGFLMRKRSFRLNLGSLMQVALNLYFEQTQINSIHSRLAFRWSLHMAFQFS